ncbi:glycosyltransferase [Candidatus Marinimicrobia bacterium]|nr:glycosyltransferase [Candidatus Neomarinimicrobiota bacterium]
MFEKYILVDALYVNNGGAKSLLNYLINNIEKTEAKVFYLLDSRIKNNHYPVSKKNKVYYMKKSLVIRHLFYLKNMNSFCKVFCFGNLPPTLRLNCMVYTYMHQFLYIKLPDNSNALEKLLWAIRVFIMKLIKTNTNEWIVQTEIVKKKFSSKFNINSKKIKCLPFFDIQKQKIKHIKTKNKFVYVSLPYKHKNHINLINAFMKTHNFHKNTELHLTLDEVDIEIQKKLNLCKSESIPIVNHGLISKTEVADLYISSEFLVFPSLTESFGLPLVEGINYGCKILASDREYVDAVCKPSIKFNPLEVEDIARCLKKSIETKLPDSEIIINNEIGALIDRIFS